MRAALLAVVVVVVTVVGVGCAKERPALTSCADDLTGVWTDGERDWMILEGRGPRRGEIEVYPLFDDIREPRAPAGVEVAPRVMDLARTPAGSLVGTLRRRYLRGADACETTGEVELSACRGTSLRLEIRSEPLPPASFAPCTPAALPPSAGRAVTWTRKPT